VLVEICVGLVPASRGVGGETDLLHVFVTFEADVHDHQGVLVTLGLLHHGDDRVVVVTVDNDCIASILHNPKFTYVSPKRE
jgi:hypothetical protein